MMTKVIQLLRMIINSKPNLSQNKVRKEKDNKRMDHSLMKSPARKNYHSKKKGRILTRRFFQRRAC
jgi:hypothetical protein